MGISPSLDLKVSGTLTSHHQRNNVSLGTCSPVVDTEHSSPERIEWFSFSNWFGSYLELPGLREQKVCLELLGFRTSASLADFQVLEIADIVILVG